VGGIRAIPIEEKVGYLSRKSCHAVSRPVIALTFIQLINDVGELGWLVLHNDAQRIAVTACEQCRGKGLVD